MKAIQLLWEAIMEATKRGRRREDDDYDGKEETNDKGSPESLVLPPEIITEILLRLPAKSIGRFRCVSKLFCSLSSNPRFAKSHLDLILRNDAILSLHRKLIVSSHNLYSLDSNSIGCEGTRDLAAVELNYPLKDDPSIFSEMIRNYVRDHLYDGLSVVDEDDRRVMLKLNAKSYRRNWVEIVGSSNGLVCISPGEGAVFLYNPTTGDSKRLPETLLRPKSVENGRDNYQSYGFGFDDLTDDYKVVKLVATSDDILQASVYSLKADSWRRICNMNYEHNDGFYTSGMHFNGAIHWVFTESSHNQRVVVAFDLQTEEFREMPLPDEAEDCSHRFRNFVVGSLNGCLCVVNSCYEVHDDIWVMNEYGEAKSWSRIRISLLYRSMKPLCSTKNGEEVLLELDGDMVLYNFETDASSNLGIRGVKLSDGFEANTYIESLISPNSYESIAVAFDLTTEEFREVSLPVEAEDCFHEHRDFVVASLNGRLCVVNNCFEEHYDIWVMNEYGDAKSWSRIGTSLLFRFMNLQCSTKNDEEFLLDVDGDMVLYNLKTDASRRMRIRGFKVGVGFEADTYVQSLISPSSYGIESRGSLLSLKDIANIPIRALLGSETQSR